MITVFVWVAVLATAVLLTVLAFKPTDTSKAKLMENYQEKKPELNYEREDWGIYGSRPC